MVNLRIENSGKILGSAKTIFVLVFQIFISYFLLNVSKIL